MRTNEPSRFDSRVKNPLTFRWEPSTILLQRTLLVCPPNVLPSQEGRGSRARGGPFDEFPRRGFDGGGGASRAVAGRRHCAPGRASGHRRRVAGAARAGRDRRRPRLLGRGGGPPEARFENARSAIRPTRPGGLDTARPGGLSAPALRAGPSGVRALRGASDVAEPEFLPVIDLFGGNAERRRAEPARTAGQSAPAVRSWKDRAHPRADAFGAAPAHRRSGEPHRGRRPAGRVGARNAERHPRRQPAVRPSPRTACSERAQRGDLCRGRAHG